MLMKINLAAIDTQRENDGPSPGEGSEWIWIQCIDQPLIYLARNGPKNGHVH